jgi:GTP pyrophosphokinase
MSLPDQDDFLAKHRFSPEQFESTGLDWKDLAAIHAAHVADIPELEATAGYISQRLRQLPEVHSLKLRVKDPEHLVAKIIRKKIEDNSRVITPETYSDEISDLIGIRAMHLFKEQWAPIHDFVTSTWDLKEQPIAYVREGDAESVLKHFERSGCQVKHHSQGYRSVHYLITSQPAKTKYTTELQVRTVFEEAWSEIDHLIRYPGLSDDPLLANSLAMFNRLAGFADEMGTFIHALRDYLAEHAAKMRGAEAQLNQKETELKKAIDDLKISDAEKEKLQARVAELRKSSNARATSAYESLFTSGLVPSASLTLGPTTYITRSTVPQVQVNCAKCAKPFHTPWLIAGMPSVCPECRPRRFRRGGPTNR